MRRNIPPPQRSSLRSGLCCPDPSSLIRPHPPRSQAHRDFTAWRLIRDAFAVRERLGDPRAVPGFRSPFFPDMPSSTTPGSSDIHEFQSRDADIGLRRDRPHLPPYVLSEGLLSDAQLESVIYAGEAHSSHLTGSWTVDATFDVVAAAPDSATNAVRFRRGW